MSQQIFQVSAAAAAGVVGLFSLFNMLGRFIWSSASDYIGRKPTYSVFFALGTVLYALVPYSGSFHSITLFVLCYTVIFSINGGGSLRCRLICVTCSVRAMSARSMASR